MHLNRLAQWLRIPAIALFSILLASCGSGDGEDPVVGGADDVLGSGFRLMFEDDFGGPAGAPRSAGKAPLTVDNWRVVTGRGPNNDGWGNNEWQTYQNSIDNLYIENGALVIEARCDSAPACNNGDGSVTSARITTKDKLEIKHGGIQARIKVPGQRGMWPAFWMLGSDWPESDWPDVGEIDIMEMLYAISDPRTVHFNLHWAGPNDAPTAAGCSGVPGAADPVNETENCIGASKTFDEKLSDDYHVYEVIWNDRSITGKIDGIIYFSRAINSETMEEFQNKMYLLLNVGVGGAGGDPSNVDWTDPQKIGDRQMKVDWVRVYEAVLPSTATLIAETGRNLDYNRIIQSQEFQGNEVIADLNSTAVPALEGNQVLQVNYTNTANGNPGGPNAGFGGIFFEFNSADATSFTNLVFSIDTSAFPNYFDMTIELKDTSDRAKQVSLRDYTPSSGPGNWKTYNIPFSAFAGVDISRILFLGFIDPIAESNYFYQADVTNPDPNQPFLVNLSQTVEITPGETYILTFKARASVARNMLAGIGLNGGPGGCCDFRSNTEIVPLTTQWQTFTYTLQPVDDNGGGAFGDSMSRVLFDMNGEAGKVFIDDVSLEVQGVPGELLTNGSFDGDLSSWINAVDPDVNIGEEAEQLISGTLYIDGIKLITTACNALPSISLDESTYNPAITGNIAKSVGQVTVDDLCAANSLATVRLEAGTDEIVVGVDLDSAGEGSTIFGFVDPTSVCPTNDEKSYIALKDQIIATYKTASATAFIGPTGPTTTSITGETFYFYSTDSNQPKAFLADTPGPSNFNYSGFESGTVLEGSFSSDATFNPVFQVTSGAGYGAEVAQMALINIREGFAVGKEFLNFKFKNPAVGGSPNDAVKVEFGIAGGFSQGRVIDLASSPYSNPIVDDWYEISVPVTGDGWSVVVDGQLTTPITNFSNLSNYNFISFTSADPAPAVDDPRNPFYYLITDIFLEESIQVTPDECAELILPPVQGSGTGATGATGGPFSVSFDDMAVTYNFVGFGQPDTISATGADPVDAGNLVAQTTKPAGSQVWAGVTVETTPGITWPVSVAESEITIRIYSPGPGLVVRMKLEESATAANSVEAEAVAAVTTGWETLTFDFDSPVAGSINPAFAYDKLSLFFGFGTVGDGTIYTWDSIEFLGTGGIDLPFSDDFEAGDLDGWTAALNGGTITADNTQAGGGTYSARLVAGPSQAPALSIEGLAAGSVSPGDNIDVSWDMCGSFAGGGEVLFPALISEPGGGAGGVRVFDTIASVPGVWTRYTRSFTADATPGNVDAGVSVQFDVVCGGDAGCAADVFFDNVNVTNGSGDPGSAASGLSCAGGGGPSGGGVTGAVFFDSVANQWDSTSLSAFDQGIGFASCTDDDGAGCPSIGWSVIAAADTARGDVIDVAYENTANFAGLVIGQPSAALDFTQFAGGNIVFDLNVTNNPANSAFVVKVDCTGCPTDGGQREQNLGVPGTGWQTFSVAVDDLVNANGGPTAGGMKIDQVTTGLVVFPAFGTTSQITYQIDNVRWEAVGAVFEDVVGNQWDSTSLSAFDQGIGFASCTDDDGAGCPSIGWSVIAAADTARGDVIDVAYENTANFAGLVIGQPSAALDFTQFAGGNIVFDLNVTNNPANSAFVVKVDCTGCPTDGGQREQNLGVPGTGWQTFSVAVDDLVNANGGPTAGGMKIDQVTTGLVVFPAFGTTSQITYQIDNVRWEAAGGGGGGGGGGGASGTATIDFEAGGFGAGFTWVTFENDDNPVLQVISNLVPGAGNTSANVGAYTARATGQEFAGFESGPGDFGSYVIDASTRYVKLWVYKTVISDVGMQLAVGAAARPPVRVANTVTNQWEQLTFDFNELIGFGEWETGEITKIVVFPDWTAARGENTIYVDNISFEATP